MFYKLFQIQNPKGVMGINRRNLELVYRHNHRKHYRLADDKVLTKQLLEAHKIATATTYAVIRKTGNIKRKWEQCKQYDAVAIKPANGCGGDGIKILKKDSEGNFRSGGRVWTDTEVYKHITSIVSGFFSMNSLDSCLIEKCIVPHPFFAEIYNAGVPDFRVITLKGTPIMAMLRMPTSESDGKANLHQKGVGIGIHMGKGVLTQVYDGKRYTHHHPDNPNPVYGKEIPYWEEILTLSEKTAEIFPLDYLGIDIVIDEAEGPQIMEVNVRPGLGIQLVNRCGLQQSINENLITSNLLS
ncbi:sugar-transfer associated ATP-grasp domain-containing protein [Aureisphaera galaxeae]|uniref:sugar-transfer associated ATP-grasp domain-containing protein n=1 Tax=Aureisphaera galaxeae TaxID=1538023 RepID=UPI0023504D0D|nr:sugar-transfer associated ATP-grasp domain-containing protein [Aureisphaera galaxeae]MDC8002861.1 sugar-transfer associated ATP-grasp domain-containing protein [Aureisphaera galaxeae]